MKKIGIYKIENVVNKKYYIGSSNNIDIRWTAHKRAKEKGNLLQRSIKKHGIQDFYFEVLEECAEADLLKIEQQYLDIAFLIPHMIYNTNPLAACPPNTKGRKHSAESCAKISAAHKGKKRGKHSAESCAKISAAHKGKKRGKRSAEHCAKLSAAQIGKKHSAESCAKISAAQIGKKHSAESCAKISAARRSKTIHSFRNINTGETYTGILYDFCDKYNMFQSKGNIVSMTKGRVNIVKGWVLV